MNTKCDRIAKHRLQRLLGPKSSSIDARVDVGLRRGANVGGPLSRSRRKQLIACLRMAHRCLGMKKKHLGVGLAVPRGRIVVVSSLVTRLQPIGLTATVALAMLSMDASVRFALGADFNSNNTTGVLPPLASGIDSSAGGYGSVASNTQGLAVGSRNVVSGAQSTGLGNDVAVTGNTAIGIGADDSRVGILASNLTGTSATYRLVTGVTPVALDFTPTLASGNMSMAIGAQSQATADYSTVIGWHSAATGIAALAVGDSTFATGVGASAFGAGAAANAANSVALGSGSIANRFGIAGLPEAFSGTTVTSTQGAVSVGAIGAERQIINVAGGTQDTDAVNVRQLRSAGNSLATSLGGNAGFDPLTNIYTGPTYTIAGRTYNNVGSALTALGTGAGSAFVSDNTTLAAAPAATGINASAGGFGASATGAGSTVVGNGARDNGNAGAVALGNNASVLGAGSIAIGQGTTANTSINIDNVSDFRNPGLFKQINNLPLGITTFVPTGVAIGALSTVGNKGGVAIGYNNNAGNTPGSQPSFALGANNLASGNNSLTLGLNNTASNVGAIAIGTDSQATGLRTIAMGRESYAYGDYSVAQGYVASAYGTNSLAFGPNSVAGVNGGAAAGDVAIGSGATSTLGNSVALGAGSVASRGAETAYTGYGVGTQTSAGELAVGTPAATRTITGVAAGRLPTDAVNVSQLSTVGANLAGSFGGGAAFDPTTGAYTPPTFTVGGQTYNNVASALTAGNALAVQYTPNAAGAPTNAIDLTKGGALAPVAVTGLANATAPTGAVALGQMPMRYSTAGAPTTPNPTVPSNDVTLVGANVGAPVGVHNVAAGTLSGTSTDAVNGSQLFSTNQQVSNLTNGTAGLVQQTAPGAPITVGGNTGGTVVNFANNAGAARRLIGVANGTVGAGSTDAINGGQLASTAGSVATALGGGAAVNPDGTIAAPTYNVANGSFNNVGSALTALNNGINNGQLGPFVANNAAARPAPAATGANAVAGGFGASATGANSTIVGSNTTDNGVTGATVMGSNASVTQAGGVALGSGATATRAALAGAPEAFSGTGVTSTQGAVSVGAVGAERQIINVAGGTQDTDAVNVRQLRSVGNNLATSLGGGATFDPATNAYTAPAYAVGGQIYGNVGDALAAGNALAVQYTPNAAGAPTNAIDLTKGGTLAPVVLTGLANATTQTGAVALGQMPMQYSTAGAPKTPNPAVPSNDVTLVGANGGAPVGLHNVSAGTLSTTSTDAVNGSQLFATNQQVAGLANGTAGLVQQAGPGAPITVGAGTAGTAVDFTNNVGTARTLNGVAAGNVALGSTQAINGGQFYNTTNSLATALGGGAGVNPDGTVSAPTYTVAGSNYNDVGGAIGALDTGLASGQIGAFRSDNTAGAAAPIATGANSVAGGFGSSATGVGSTTLGNGATDNGNANATVVGNGASVTSGLVGSNVALGQGTVAGRGAETNYTGYGVGTQTSAGELAVGAPTAARTITGVAAGRLATDAANVGQLQAVGSDLATSLGGGSGFDPVTGTYTAPSYTVAGATYNNVGGAIGALDAGLSNGQIGAFRSNNAAGAAAPTATGANSVAGGFGSSATGAASTVVGNNATDNGNANAVVLGNGASVAAGLAGSNVALGQGAAATRGALTNYGAFGLTAAQTSVGEAAVGSAAAPRQITGVAAGSEATDAVNVAQLQGAASELGTSTASALGGGSTYDLATGQVTAPSYALDNGTVTATNVGAAITNLDGRTTSNTNAIAGLQNGTVGLVQQAGPGAPITVGAGTDGTAVNFTNNAGTARTLAGVAPGQVAAGSTEAVNGSQLYDNASSVASALGGGSTVNTNGTVSAPSYSVNGTAYNNVGGAITALDSTGVKYDTAPGGGRGNSITLAGGNPNQPVVIHNVGGGVARTDAANFGQVQDAEARATQYTNARLAGVENEMSGMNSQLNGLAQGVNEAKRDARTAAAVGLAAASLRYDDRPGKFSVAAGGGYWKGYSAGAFGAGYTLPDGRFRVNVTAATDGRDVGAAGGLSYTFN